VVSRVVDVKYRALFEAIDEAVCFLEKLPTRPDGQRDFRYLAVNRAMQEIFGVEDLAGRTSRDTFPDESESWYDDFDRVLATGEAMRFERETRPQGLVLSIFVARVEDGTQRHVIAAMRDVTARKRADFLHHRVSRRASRAAVGLRARRGQPGL
jgi:PAS domain S-box-containing protein